jgi:hypothetical protein
MPVAKVGALVRTASQPKRVQSCPLATASGPDTRIGAAFEEVPTKSAIEAAAKEAMTRQAATLTA